MDGPDYVDFSVQPASVDQKVGPEWFEGFSRDIRDEEHLESSDSVLSQLAGYGPCYIMDGEGYRWKVLGQPHGCDDLDAGQPYPPLWFYPAKEGSVQYIKCRYGKIFVVDGDDALQAMVPTFSGSNLTLEQEDDPKHIAVVGGEDIWLTMYEGSKVGGAPQDAYRPVTSLDLEVNTEEPTEASEPANWKPVKVGHYTLDSKGNIKVYNYMTWTLTCTTVDKQSKWWDLTFEVVGTALTAKVAAGMSEGPTFGGSGDPTCDHGVHPKPAWGWMENSAYTDTVGDGTTYFYVKATFSETEIEMGKNGTTTSEYPEEPIELKSYRYQLDYTEIVKVVGATQPDDTKAYKYKLLGKIVASGGKVTNYWWRTNHIFNWTFYSFTVLADEEVECSSVLPPDVPAA
tara:strand:- start:16258 stop:17454 length:1197 start_codon:yes stop_codon:yes gene_type:complete